ncbi:bipartite regulator domain [Escherichia coli]|uniref:Bipartite regulator domain n=1 Tax=Escherichia coli TaxID=562 RepID=A0A377CVM9_ECOLX|nr:bipartite regulator domain [Escherichia coli]
MGLCSRYKSLTCNSCSMHCQIMPEESPRLQYCANSCFCMWPEESSYFNRGVVEGILTKNHNARLSGYIFVDFSVSFLRLFLEKDWIDYLASTDMGIVLVSDRNMQSLANYCENTTQQYLLSYIMMMVLMLPMKRSDNYLLVVIYHLPEVTH